jgi:hypothetical protein
MGVPGKKSGTLMTQMGADFPDQKARAHAKDAKKAKSKILLAFLASLAIFARASSLAP